MNSQYMLPARQAATQRLTIGWLTLAIASLLTAGVYAILLVLSRAPYTKDVFPWVDFFRTALVVHVDFTVIFWFLSFAGVFWCLNSAASLLKVGKVALGLCAVGAVVVAASPFFGAAQPLINNYVPVLQDPIFYAGMLIFAAGFFLMVLRSLLAATPMEHWNGGEGALRFGCYAAALTAMLALVILGWTYLQMPAGMKGEDYYEVLFWGGGHVIQFTHTVLMLVAWLWLASASGMTSKLRPGWAGLLLGLGAVMVLLAPLPFIIYDVDSSEFKRWFVWLMTVGGPVAAVPIGLILLWDLFKASSATVEQKSLRAALVLSITLFALGGWIGLMIEQSSTMITAHYHGSTVAATMAYMAITYHLLPQLGFDRTNSRWARIQVYAYGLGQLVHIMGLAWAGSHGMKRKIAGSAQTLDNVQQTIAMGMVGVGGVIAVIGGFMFFAVVLPVMLRRLRRSGAEKQTEQTQHSGGD